MKNKVLLSLLFLLLGLQNAHAWTVELTEAELQEKIDKRLPIEKNKLLLKLQVSAIDVELKEGSDRVGLISKMQISSPHFTTGKGTAYIEGQPVYHPDDGTFYFNESQVREVKFENIPDKYLPLVQKIFEVAIQQRLAETPIYKLDESKTKHQLAKTLLKSVRVIDKKLVLELGLF